MTRGGTQPGAPDSGNPAARGEQDPAGQRSGDRFRIANAGRARKPANAGGAGRPTSAGSGYTYLSYMLGGMLLYGFIGWLIGRWTHQAYLLPVGMVVGLALAIVLIIYRVTRSDPGT